MGRNTTAMKRGFNYDIVNERMSIMVDGVEAIRLTKSSTGCDIRLLGDTPASNYINFDAGAATFDIVSSLSGASADDAISITVTDSTTGSSGYARGLYINATASGTKTSSGEHNSLGVDLTVTGDTPYAYIQSLYVTTSGNPTIGLVSGISIYSDNIGTGVSSWHLLDLQTGNPTASAASTREAYIRIRNHGTGTPTTIIYAQANNNAKAATYLFEQDASTVGPAETGTLTNDTIGSTAEDGFINIKMGATAAKIPFWYDD